MKSEKEQPTKKKTKTSNVVNIDDPITGEQISYYLEGWVRKKFDEKVIPDLYKKDKDCIIAIDGEEGAGKSTLGMQWCKYIDPTFNLDRVVFTPDEFEEAIHKAKPGQAIMFDEAFTGFSSRASVSKVNQMLVSLMMQIRQKNLFIAIILPTFFLLDKYIAIWRTRILVHTYEVRGERGYFKIYSSRQKKMLILSKESKTYSYGISTRKKGRFYGVFALGGPEIEKKYREKKLKALESAKDDNKNDKNSKYLNQRDYLIYILHKDKGLSYREMENWLSEKGFELSYRQIATICSKFEQDSKE